MASENDPRVYFAAERTMLAWLRTGLAVIGVGFLVARFGLFLRLARGGPDATASLFSTFVGVAFVILGSAAIALSAWQHRRFCKHLGVTERPVGYGIEWGLGFAFLVAALGALLAFYLIWTADNTAVSIP